MASWLIIHNIEPSGIPAGSPQICYVNTAAEYKSTHPLISTKQLGPHSHCCVASRTE